MSIDWAVVGHDFRDLRRDIVRISLVAVAYFGAAKLGLAFAFSNPSVTAVWPPSGLALAAVVLWGGRVWPGIWLGALAANITTQGSVLAVCGIATGNTLEPLLGAFLLSRVGFHRDLGRIRDVGALLVLAAGLSTLVSATIGVASLAADGLVARGMLFSTWRIWWLGDVGGDILVASAILVLASAPRLPRRRLAGWEALSSAAVLVAVSAIAFSGSGLRPYAVLPVLFWVALRFGQPGAVLGGLVVAAFAVWFTKNGRGEFVGGTLDAALLRAQTFVGIAALAALLVGAVRSEQRSSAEAAEEFRELLEASPDGTVIVNERGEIVIASSEAQRLFGLSREELIGTAVETLIPDPVRDRRESHRAAFWRAPRTRPMGAGLELTARRGDGSELPVEIRLSPIVLETRPMVIAAIRDVSDRRAREAALGRAEQRFRAAFELAPVGMTLISVRPDNSGRYLAVNRSFAQLLGFEDPSEVVGRHYREFSHPDEASIREALLGELMTEGYVRAERRYLTRDRRELWAEIHVALIRDAAGQPDHLVTQVLDLTARRHSEAELRQGAAIAGNLAEAVLMARVGDGAVVYANARCERLFGYGPGELLGVDADVLFAPGGRARIADDVAREHRWSGEIAGVRHDGTRIWCYANVSQFEHPEHGTVWITAASDITAQRRQADALREAEERFRGAFEHAAIGMALVAPDGRWLRVNRTLSEIVGYSEAQLLERTFQDLTHPADLAASLESVRQLLAGEIRSSQLEKRYIHSSGHTVWITLSVSLVHDAAGQPLYFVTQIQDITERKRSEVALEAAVEIGRAVGGETNLERVLQVIAERSRALVDASGVAILLGEGDELVAAATAGSLPRELVGRRVPAGPSMAARALHSGRPQRVDRIGRARLSTLERLGVSATSALVIPLRFRQANFGVIEAFDRVAGPEFRDEDERLLLAAAGSAAIAIATAQSVGRERLVQTMRAAEEERRRWARELHDETLQALGGLRVMLSSAHRTTDEQLLRHITTTALEQLDTEIESLRVLISELRPAALDELGLHAALLALAERTRSTHGIDVKTTIDAAATKPARLDPELETVIYRVVQEALTNAARHARPETIDVELSRRDGEIHVAVTDDGSGFDPAQPTKGYGLVGIRERVSLIGGRVNLHSGPAGTAVRVSLPAVGVA